MDKFVTSPRVELVGRPIIDVPGLLAFLDDHDFEWSALREKRDNRLCLSDRDAEWLIEAAGRLCYLSYDGKGRDHDGHIKNLIEVGHGACIEHATFNFMIWNVSRSLTHELVRHRIASYSQLSQRYVDASNTSFVVPPAIQELENTDKSLYEAWIAHCEASRALYALLTTGLAKMYQDIPSKLERRKKARQAARSVLPNATETKIFVTMNARAIRHFIELRANPAADLEIRKLAVAIFRIMEQEFPLITHQMRLVVLDDGTEGVESDFKRV